MTVTTPTPKKDIPPYAICNILGHATYQCPELLLLRTHLHKEEESYNEPILVFQITLPEASKQNNKALRTNHSCALCGLYGHYSHHYTKLQTFWSMLTNLWQQSLALEVTVIEEVLPPKTSNETIKEVMVWPSSVLCPCVTHPMMKQYISIHPYVLDHLPLVPPNLAYMYDLLAMSSASVGSFSPFHLLVFGPWSPVWFTLTLPNKVKCASRGIS